MEIQSHRKGNTFKQAEVIGTDDKEAAFECVMAFFGEEERRLHGWTVSGFPEDDTITVTLFTG